MVRDNRIIRLIVLITYLLLFSISNAYAGNLDDSGKNALRYNTLMHLANDIFWTREVVQSFEIKTLTPFVYYYSQYVTDIQKEYKDIIHDSIWMQKRDVMPVKYMCNEPYYKLYSHDTISTETILENIDSFFVISVTVNEPVFYLGYYYVSAYMHTRGKIDFYSCELLCKYDIEGNLVNDHFEAGIE